MYALIGKLAQYGLHKAQEFWADHGDQIIETGQDVFESIKDGIESIVDSL